MLGLIFGGLRAAGEALGALFGYLRQDRLLKAGRAEAQRDAAAETLDQVERSHGARQEVRTAHRRGAVTDSVLGLYVDDDEQLLRDRGAESEQSPERGGDPPGSG